jgi:hypothetical protein
MTSAASLRWRGTLATIVVIGLLPRLYDISAELYTNGHAWRQADSAAFVDGYLHHGLNLFSPRIAKQPCRYYDAPFGAVESELPVVAWLSALPLAALGVQWAPPWYLRAISVAFYVLTALWLFMLARRFSGEEDEHGRHVEALVTVAAFSLFPICVFYTRSPQPDGPSLFFVVAFLLHLDRWATSGRVREAALSTGAGAVMLLLKASNAYVLPIGLYLLLRRRSLRGLCADWRMWLFAALTLVPAAAWYRYAATAHAHTFDIWTYRKFTQFSDYLDLEHWKWFGLRFCIPVLTGVGCLLSVLGCVRGKAPGLPRVWFAACIAFLLLAIKANRTHVYYQLIYVLPASLAVARAVMWLWRRKLPARVALVGLIAVHLVIGYNVLWDRRDPGELWGYYNIDLPGVREAVPLIKRVVPEGERLVSIIPHPALFTGAQRFGYEPEHYSGQSVLRCMKKGVAYALVVPDWSEPPGVRVVGRSPHFKVWHRVPVEGFADLKKPTRSAKTPAKTTASTQALTARGKTPPRTPSPVTPATR